MVNDVCYTQNCPVCGRALHVRVTLLGRQVFCQHCGGGFVAADPALQAAAGHRRPPPDDRDAAVARLLEQAAQVLEQATR
jgi:hypothetical protein